MADVVLTVTIRRPPADVFGVLANLDNAAKWSRAVSETLITPGPLGVGSRRRAVVPTFAGRTSENVIEMTEFEPDRHMAMRSISGFPFPVTIGIDLSPVADGTRLGWTTRMAPRGLARLIGPVFAAAYRSAFRKDLARLKSMMEAGRL